MTWICTATKKKVLLASLAGLLLAGAVGCLLVYHGIVWPNTPSERAYPVRGVDVSSYQGEIDWETIAAQGIDFAFIKATEGSSWQDTRFATSWESAQTTDLRVGAYHFFSFESAGETQAENFIAAVPVVFGALPPVVDVEGYSGAPALTREACAALLVPLLERLEEHYGQKPVLYVTEQSYGAYIQGGYEEYPLWVRSIWRKPKLSDGRAWTFWQYSNRGRLDGYTGPEKFIDLNVFSGTQEEFSGFGM